MPDRPLPPLAPLEPPPNIEEAPESQQRAALQQEVAQLRVEERQAELPRATAGTWADQLVDQSRRYIRHVIGTQPFVQEAIRGTVTRLVDTRARLCAMTLDDGRRLPRVQYDPTAPQVGGKYIARRTVRLVGDSGPPQEVHWSIKVAGALQLYWFDRFRYTGSHTLLRTPWPLSTTPTADTIEEVFRWSTARTGGGRWTITTLLGMDGQGMITAERTGLSTTSPRDTIAGIARAPRDADPPEPPAEHDLRVIRDVSGSHPVLYLERALALGWRQADEPGTVVTMLPSTHLLLNPVLSTYDALSADTLDYYTTTDGGSSRSLLRSVPFMPSHWATDLLDPLQQSIYSEWHYSPAGRTFAWVPDTDDEATALGVGRGGVALLSGLVDNRGVLVGQGSHQNGAGVVYDVGALRESGAFVAWATNLTGRFGSPLTLELAGAGVVDPEAFHILRAGAGASWYEGQTGPSGGWTGFTPGAGAGVEVVGLDRAFSQGVVATEDLDFGSLVALYTTEDSGAHWTRLEGAAATYWATALYPLGEAVRGWILPD